MGGGLTLAAVLGHDIQTWVQFVALCTAGFAAMRWLIRHYLSDLLAESSDTKAKVIDIAERLHDVEQHVAKLEQQTAVLVDRSERPPRPPFP